MFCSRCGQEQFTEMRFCSRCGLPLGVIGIVTANNGQMPADLVQSVSAPRRKIFRRNNVLKIAALWLIIFWLFLLPIAAINDHSGEAAPVMALIGFFGAVFFTAIAFMFFSSDRKNTPMFPNAANIPNTTDNFTPNQVAKALPPQNEYDLNAVPQGNWRGATTNNLVSPSVTENTTRLLNEDEIIK